MATTNNQKAKRLTDLIKNIQGDFAEVGVWKGDTFKHLISLAKQQGKQAHAYDSFVGMNDPSDKDMGQYQKGKYSVGGVKEFKKMLVASGHPLNDFKCFDGYIPMCFEKSQKDQMYSFLYLDVDHYEATKTALPWCWNHITLGGVFLLDDYFPGKIGLATLAIREWLDTIPEEYKEIELDNTQLALKKLK